MNAFMKYLPSPRGSLPAIVGSSALLAGLSIFSALPAQAFTITGQLTGDPRPDNPDNLIVDVTIFVNETIAAGTVVGSYTFASAKTVAADEAFWIIDINSPLHPNAKLDEFYFNLSPSDATKFSFSGYDPSGWLVSNPGTVQGGGAGGTSFLFQAADPVGSPNAADVTNTQPLSFLMTYSGGSLAPSNFTSAPNWSSQDTTLGSGQLGAHLQSLTATNGGSDSGFVLGNYVQKPDNPGVDPVGVPEPGTVAGLAVAAAAAAGLRRRKSR